MGFSWWGHNKQIQAAKNSARRAIRVRLFRPLLEVLEDRCLPSVYTVIGTGDDPSGSGTVTGGPNSFTATTLRDALTAANASPAGTLNVIDFDIPGSGVQTIALQAALPTIINPVILDGTSQPGYAGSPLIELNGTSAGQGTNFAGANGLDVSAGNSIIEGLDIQGFSGNGIVLENGGGNTIRSNFIGTEATGALPEGNAQAGIFVTQSSANNIIGSPGAGNVIAANLFDGITLEGSGGTTVAGNRIGTDSSGQHALGNGGNGVSVDESGDTIGGTAFGAGNVIAANGGDGINVAGSDDSITGNWFGTDTATISNLGNGGNGINAQSSSNLTIGGAGAGNVIAFNGSQAHPGAGVLLNFGSGNLISQNAIFANTGLGIELQNGANNSQPAPTLTDAVGQGSVLVQGTLSGSAGQQYTLEFFANSSADPSGFGQGQTFLGTQTVTVGHSGSTAFQFTGSLPAGNTVITATATDSSNDTSAFSADQAVAAPSTFVWTGLGPDNYWTDPENWQGALAPSPGSNLVFPANANQFAMIDNFPAGTVMNSLAFTGPGYTVTGNTLTLMSGIRVSQPGVGGPDTLALAGLTFTGNQTITANANAPDVSSELVLSDPLTLPAGATLTVAGGGVTDIQGPITGPGGLILSGPGTLYLDNGQNTFSGGTLVTGGILAVTASGALDPLVASGTSGVTSGGGLNPGVTTVDSAGTLLLDNVAYTDSSATIDLAGGTLAATGTSLFAGLITLSANSTILSEANADLTLSGGIFGGLAFVHTFTVTFTGLGDTDVAGPIDLGTAVVMNGVGTLELDAVGDFDGGTTINSGTVVVNANGALGGALAGVTTVNSGGTLVLANVDYQVPSFLTLSGGILGSTGLSTWTGPITQEAPGSSYDPVAGSTLSLAGVISGGAALAMFGQGTLQLESTNNYTGGTTTVSGTLVVTADGALGPGGSQDFGTTVFGGILEFDAVNYTTPEALGLDGGVLISVGYCTFAGPITLTDIVNSIMPTAGSSLDLAGAIGGIGELAMVGPGTLQLDNSNSFQGGVDVQSGLLIVTADGALGASNGTTTVLAGAAIELDNVYYHTLESLVLDNSGAGREFGAAPILIGLSGPLGESGFAGLIHIEGGAGVIQTDSNSTLIVGGSIVLPDQNTLTVLGAGSTDIQGSIGAAPPPPGVQGIVPTTGTVIMAGTGILQLDHGNPFRGGLEIDSGTVVVTANGALGLGTTSVVTGAALECDDVDYSDSDAPIVLDGGTLVGRSAPLADTTFAGPITLATGSTVAATANSNFVVTGAIAGAGFNLIASGSGTTDIQGVISGSNTILTIAGPGTLVLGAANTYTGNTVLQGGTLVVNGNQPNSAVTLDGGTLAGTGAVGPITAAFGGNLNPGPLYSTGTLNVAGNVALPAGNSFNVQLNSPTQYDQLNVTSGTISLNLAALQISLNYSALPGDAFTLISAAPGVSLEGTFEQSEGAILDLPGPGGFLLPFQITYHGGPFQNEVILTRVQEAFWTGAGTDNLWSDGANWAAGVAPSPGSLLVFPDGASQTSSNDDLPAGTSFAGLYFQPAGYAIRGNALTITNSIVAEAAPAAGSVVIDNPLTLGSQGNNLVVAGTGNVELVGPVTDSNQVIVAAGANLGLEAPATFAVASDTALTVDGTLTVGDGAALTDAGTITVAPSGALTILGSVTVQTNASLDDQGSVSVNLAPFNESSSLTINGLLTVETGVTLTDNVSVTVGPQGTLTDDGTVHVDSFIASLDDQGTLNVAAGATLTADIGVVTIETNATLNDQGTVNVNDNAPAPAAQLHVDGAFTVDGGSLADASSIDVAASGTLLDTGTVSITATATLDDGGTVAVGRGNTLDDAGTLTVEQQATLSDAGTVNVSPSTAVLDDAGTITIVAAITSTQDGVTIVEEPGGTLNDAGNTTVDQAATMVDANTLSVAAGTDLQIDGSLTVDADGSADVPGTITVLAQGTVTNKGLLTVEASGAVDIDVGSLTVAAGGTLDDKGAVNLNFGPFATNESSLTIDGTLTVVASATLTDSTSIVIGPDGTLDDEGTVAVAASPATLEVQALGTLDVGTGGAGTAAQFNVGGTVTVDLNGTFNDSGTVTVLASPAGHLTIAGLLSDFGDAPLDVIGALTLQSGGVLGANSVSGAGILNFQGGTVQSGFDGVAGFIVGELSGFSNVTIANPVQLSGQVTLTAANTVTFAGQVTLVQNATLTNDASALVVNANVALGQNTLTLAGTGVSTIAGVVSGSGSLVVASGNVTLDSANGYTGETTINGGVLVVDADKALGPGQGSVTVNAGGTLQVGDNVNYATPQTVTINGSGAPLETGAFDSLFNASFAGPITLGSASVIGSDSGTTLTLSGGVNTAGHVLTVDFGNLTLQGGLSGAGGLTVSDSGGTVELDAANTYTGDTNITAGTLQIGATGTLTEKGTLTVAAGASFTDNGTFTLASGGTLNDSGTVTAASSPSETFTVAGTLNEVANATLEVDGTLTLQSGGVLSLGYNGVIGTGTVNLQGGTVGNGGNASGIANPINLSGTVSVAGGVFTGQVTLVSNATVNVLQLNELDIIGNISLGRNLILTLGGTGDAALSGIISGAGGLTIAGAGGNPVDGGSAVFLSNTNTYTGGTIVSTGTLALNNGTPGTGTVTVDSGGTLEGSSTSTFPITLNGGILTDNSGLANPTFQGNVTLTADSQIDVASSEGLGGPVGEGITVSGSINNQGHLLTTNILNGISEDDPSSPPSNVDFAGPISGSGGLVVDDAQENPLNVDLSAANTYTGGTTINGGTVQVLGIQPKSAVTVNNGGTLEGTGTIGALVVNAGGQVTPVTQATLLRTLTVASANFAVGSTLNIVGTSGTGGVAISSKLAVTGALTLGAGNSLPALSLNLSGLNVPATLTNIVTYPSGKRTGTFATTIPVLPNNDNAVAAYGGTGININVTDPPAPILVSSSGRYNGQLAYTTIQAAVNAARAGSVIEVAAGTYNENVTVNKALTIEGAQFGQSALTGRTNPALETVVNGSFTVTAANVSINGFTVQNNGAAAAITIQPGSANDQVLDNILQDAASGLIINGASRATVSGNRFNNTTNQDILLENQAVNNTVRQNLVEGSAGDGIDVFNSSGNAIVANTITSNHGAGIVLVLASNTTIQGNTLSGNANNQP